MSDQYEYSTGDVIRNARARLINLQRLLVLSRDQLTNTAAPDYLGAAQAEIERLAADLDEDLAVMGGDCWRYADGSAVASTIALSEDSGVLHVWHQRRGNQANVPHVIARHCFDDGSVADVVVAARGTLDVVRRNTSEGADHV